MAGENGRLYAGIFHEDMNAAKEIIVDPALRCKLYEAIGTYSETGELPSDLEKESPMYRYLFNNMKNRIDYQETAYRKKVEGGRKGGKAKAENAKLEAKAGNDEEVAKIKTALVHAGLSPSKPEDGDEARKLLRRYSTMQIIAAINTVGDRSRVSGQPNNRWATIQSELNKTT